MKTLVINLMGGDFIVEDAFVDEDTSEFVFVGKFDVTDWIISKASLRVKVEDVNVSPFEQKWMGWYLFSRMLSLLKGVKEDNVPEE